MRRSPGPLVSRHLTNCCRLLFSFAISCSGLFIFFLSDNKSDHVSGLLGSQEKYEQWRQLRMQIEELTDHWLSVATTSLALVQSRSVVVTSPLGMARSIVKSMSVCLSARISRKLHGRTSPPTYLCVNELWAE